MPDASFLNSLMTTIAIALACAVLSVFVVLRRWAFVGEGISHAGLGGAGSAWMLALIFPAFDSPTLQYACVVIFCLLTAIAVGWLTREDRLHTDTAIGIFLVASLAWGFLAQNIYLETRHAVPSMFPTLLFGQMKGLSREFAISSLLICTAIVLLVGALRKEIVAYAFDPLTARTSGVNAGAIHYLLMLLITLVVVIGVRVVGSVLVIALLVLPGAAALLLSKRLTTVVIASIAIGLSGAIAGLLISHARPIFPIGPAIVLMLVIEFVAAYFFSRVKLAL